MALTDNLVVKVKAESGQTVITDSVNSFSWSGGTGSAALINDGTYGYLWRVTGGTRTATLSGLGNWTDTTPKANTFAMRFRVTGRGANYQKYAIFGQSSNNGQFIGNTGTSTGNLRATLVLGGSPATNHAIFAYTTGDVITLVHRFEETGSTSDITSGWKNGGAGHPTPDSTATNSVSSATLALIYSEFGVTTGETLDILNFAAWNRGLTDSEAASVADDITQLWSGGATDGTASGTPDTLDLIAPAATAVGTGGADGSASGSPPAASITAPAATAIGTTAGSGTITTPALKNNTGTILASISGWTVNVYNASTGALVVQKTGLTTSAGGVLTVTDAAIAAGTTYAYEPVHAIYGRRLPTGVAS